ncbi:xaa-Pro aminopeptidase 3-like [Tubulanus polymorphus]|uniref:xaa-Pro aminopeptidase 3-like n=1 Tax=Tubulanus polymorphus TaxID=672921 RepID=UPI003DA605D1
MAAAMKFYKKINFSVFTRILRNKRGLITPRFKSTVTKPIETKDLKYYGQPSFQSHPHLISKHDDVTRGISKHEFKQRRNLLLKRIINNSPGSEHLLILPSAPRYYMTTSVPYKYRQNTDFLYLSGFLEADSILVLYTSKQGTQLNEAIFVPDKNERRELWEGTITGPRDAVQLLGIDNAYGIKDFNSFLIRFVQDLSSDKYVLWYNVQQPVAINSIDDLIRANKHSTIQNPIPHLHHLRLFKSKPEIALLEQCNRITAESFKQVMKFTKPGMSEAHLDARMEYECRLRGADYLAYIPVVAGGNRACTIHYVRNNQIMNDGELVLVDAGAEYHGYCSDVTRTWPVSGRFSAAQREIYDAVLRIQKVCLDMCQPGFTLDNIYLMMLNHIQLELEKLELIPNHLSKENKSKLVREICPHHVGHYFGMDIHDSGSSSQTLPFQPGMAITVEPAIYIPESRTDFPTRYRGIGIRIEDDVLITSDGHINLTENCPKHPDEIESLMCS